MNQREPRQTDDAFLAFVRKRRCCACSAPPPSQAAHIRMGSIENGKRPTGTGEKPSDRWTVPLCSDCHLDGPEAQHKVGERRFWARVGIDPFKTSTTLYTDFCFEKWPSEKREGHARAASSILQKRSSQAKRIADSGRKPKTKIPSRPLKSANRWPKRFGR